MIEKVRRIILDAMEVCTLPKCPEERVTCDVCATDRICQLFEGKLLFNLDWTPDIQAMLKELKESRDALDKLIEKEMEEE